VLFAPETRAALEGAPGGYVPTIAPMYGLILASATPEAAAWAFENFPGVYAVGPTLEGFELPIFDAHYGRAPALQFWGDHDLITPREDVSRFQAEYGGPVRLAVLPGGGHTPNFEAVREDFWRQTFEFLDVRGRGYGVVEE
jgi:pimeloyl-ACP methyl ester carboxylesterase